MTFAKMSIDVNKKVNGKYELVGKVDIHVPTLEDAGFSAERQKDDKGQDVVEDGLPIYKTEAANWVMGAMLAQVKAQARNKLLPGTGTLKPNAQIATDWPSLVAEGERGGNGEALAIVREAKASFEKFVATLGKSEKAQATLKTLFGNKQALALQSTENKAKVEKYVEDYAASLDAPALERYMPYLTSVQNACKETVDAEDF